MAKIERLWSDQELIAMEATVVSLRKIRTATTTKPEEQKKGIIKFFPLVRESRSRLPQKDKEVVLFDAEKLANTAAYFFALKISKTASGDREKQEWQDTLSDTNKKYGKLSPTTYARTTKQDVTVSLVGHLRHLSIDPSYMLKWDLLQANHLGAQTIEQLVDGTIGVISPLSGDYLLANTYSKYLELLKKKKFPVKPAACSSDLTFIVLPVDSEGKNIFGHLSQIGIYLDAVDTGNTGKALYQFLKQVYPTHIVHEPIAQKIEFIPSKKMRNFWKKV